MLCKFDSIERNHSSYLCLEPPPSFCHCGIIECNQGQQRLPRSCQFTHGPVQTCSSPAGLHHPGPSPPAATQQLPWGKSSPFREPQSHLCWWRSPRSPCPSPLQQNRSISHPSAPPASTRSQQSSPVSINRNGARY